MAYSYYSKFPFCTQLKSYHLQMSKHMSCILTKNLTPKLFYRSYSHGWVLTLKILLSSWVLNRKRVNHYWWGLSKKILRLKGLPIASCQSWRLEEIVLRSYFDGKDRRNFRPSTLMAGNFIAQFATMIHSISLKSSLILIWTFPGEECISNFKARHMCPHFTKEWQTSVTIRPGCRYFDKVVLFL